MTRVGQYVSRQPTPLQLRAPSRPAARAEVLQLVRERATLRYDLQTIEESACDRSHGRVRVGCSAMLNPSSAPRGKAAK
jgi:hypothetical protein